MALEERINQRIGAPTLGDNWEDWFGPKAHEAVNTLKSFAVVPCFDGGIRLEGQRQGLDFELNIDPLGAIDGVYLGPASPQEQIADTPAPREARCNFCGDLDGDCSCDRKPASSGGASFLVHAATSLFGCCLFCLIFYIGYRYDLATRGGAFMALMHAQQVYSTVAAIMSGGITGGMMTKWWKERK